MSKTKTTKILLTGGHAATSALAVIEKIYETHDDWQVSWIGSENAFSNEKAKTLDFQLFPEIGVKCYSVKSGKLQRQVTLSSIIDLFNIPVGFFQALNIISTDKPDVILSFGGFVALPVALAGKILGIPVLIHEQTVAVGLANKLSLPFVDEVLLSRKESQKYFGNNKSSLVGLPLHKATRNTKNVKKSSKPVSILVTGGSRGSQVINMVIKEILPFLLKKYKVTHLTGSLDVEKLSSYKRLLPANVRDKYVVYAHVPPLEMSVKYAEADIVIARAGAHTVAEVMALGKAAIFIPIPWVQKNEQFLNAKLAEKYSNSIIIEENNLSSETLLQAINIFEDHWKSLNIFTENEISKLDKNSAEKIVSILEKYVQ